MTLYADVGMGYYNQQPESFHLSIVRVNTPETDAQDDVAMRCIMSRSFLLDS